MSLIIQRMVGPGQPALILRVAAAFIRQGPQGGIALGLKLKRPSVATRGAGAVPPEH